MHVILKVGKNTNSLNMFFLRKFCYKQIKSLTFDVFCLDWWLVGSLGVRSVHGSEELAAALSIMLQVRNHFCFNSHVILCIIGRIKNNIKCP